MTNETTTKNDSLSALANAATNLCFSRRESMDTAEEWDQLERTVLAVAEAPADEEYPCYGFRGDFLIRFSRLTCGEIEKHSCTGQDLEAIAHAIEAGNGRWFVVDELATETNRDWVAAYIAVEFLRYRGMVRMTETGNRLEPVEGFRANNAIADFAVAVTLKDLPYTFR